MTETITFMPQSVDDLSLAFGGDMLKLMPKNIPEEFYRYNASKWNRLVNDWFFYGLKALALEPKEGIDEKAALRHIGAIIGSFQPKHEDKEAACSYLFSLWFKDALWERKDK